MHELSLVPTHALSPFLLMHTGVHIDYNVDKISYDDFINRELILFSHAGDVRRRENQKRHVLFMFNSTLCELWSYDNAISYWHEDIIQGLFLHRPALLDQFVLLVDRQSSFLINNFNLHSIPCHSIWYRQTMSVLCLTSWMVWSLLRGRFFSHVSRGTFAKKSKWHS